MQFFFFIYFPKFKYFIIWIDLNIQYILITETPDWFIINFKATFIKEKIQRGYDDLNMCFQITIKSLIIASKKQFKD